jgi:putative hydrolase of the HAD superfamily
LVAHHGVDAAVFLADCHAIDLSGLRPDPRLLAGLEALPGRRIVHTNGARGHAVRVLEALGLTGAFEAIYAIKDKGLVAKPRAGAYAHVIAADGIDPTRAVMIEDSARNLVEPKRLGMGTVWLTPEGGIAPAHVDRMVPDLLDWLAEPGPAPKA